MRILVRVRVVVELAGANQLWSMSERKRIPSSSSTNVPSGSGIMISAVGLIEWWEQLRHNPSSVVGSSL
jgi:hypothetical protein